MSGINPTTKPVQPLATDDINTLLVRTTHAINAQARLGWAFAPSAQDTPNMTVAIAAGAILSGSTRTEVAAQSTATITAPATHPRIDLVAVDKTTGAVSVVAGAEGASPSEPALPAGKLPVALVALTVGMTAITNSNITDVRVGGGSGPELAQNLLSPSADAAPSTQAVVDALDRMRETAAFHAFVAQIAAARSSGPIPGGYMWMMLTDELATKTGATYNSTGHYYTNESSGSTTENYTGIVALSSYTYINRSAVLPNNRSITALGIYSTGAHSGKVKILLRNSAGNYTQVATANYSHTGSGWEYFACPYTVPATGDYYPAVWGSGNVGMASVARASYASDYGTGSGWTEDSNNCPVIRHQWTDTSNNMTLIPTAITAGAAPTVADIYLLHHSVDAVTLGTDIKLRVSADNGANWSAYATITEVCQFDSSTKLLKASVTLPTSGTSLKWELTTYNNKAQRIKPVDMQLR